ncbi:hypothetical protein, partial [Microbulbifer rhizosphaerae]|uniref:hypothetical protein n=1 Tax=Microbulbifer rhizosphaerae TaxID=1562603 RepID=UPI001C84DCFD
VGTGFDAELLATCTALYAINFAFFLYEQAAITVLFMSHWLYITLALVHRDPLLAFSPGNPVKSIR